MAPPTTTTRPTALTAGILAYLKATNIRKYHMSVTCGLDSCHEVAITFYSTDPANWMPDSSDVNIMEGIKEDMVHLVERLGDNYVANGYIEQLDVTREMDIIGHNYSLTVVVKEGVEVQ